MTVTTTGHTITSPSMIMMAMTERTSNGLNLEDMATLKMGPRTDQTSSSNMGHRGPRLVMMHNLMMTMTCGDIKKTPKGQSVNEMEIVF